MKSDDKNKSTDFFRLKRIDCSGEERKYKQWMAEEPCKDDYSSIYEQVMRVSNTANKNKGLTGWWPYFFIENADAYKEFLKNEQVILEAAEKVIKKEGNQTEIEKNFKEGTLKKYLLSRLNKSALKKGEDYFFNLLELGTSQEAVVVSIDIRDSTQLMLNAKRPELFADFIGDVTAKIFEIVKENYGITDKFTGDGLLCFFPKKYSGDDAVYYALKAAAAAHKLFATEYKKHYNKFSVVKADVGLGIGIDAGEVYFTPVCQDPTIVGIPVVYACRLSAAPAYHTYLNQPAFELVEKKYKNLYSYDMCTISFKNQGSMVAYDVNLNYDAISPKDPDWLNDN